jgi:hypothetical protein
MVKLMKNEALRIPAIVMTSVIATYVAMIPLQADHFLKAVLRGHYWRYYELFIPIFVILASIGLWWFRNARMTLSKVLIAVGASYTASLVAFFFLPARMPTAELLSLHGIDWAFFFSPLVSLCWFYGGGVVLALWAFSRKGNVIAH